MAVLDAADPGISFAETLGDWVGFADAIALSAVLGNGSAGPRTIAPAVHSKALGTVQGEFDRICGMLKNSIAASFSQGPAKPHIRLPDPALDAHEDMAKAYLPYRRFYEAHQRDMELGIQPLRFNVRDAVAKAAPRLAVLAELDASLERILAERESRLLAKAPQLLAKRFDRLSREHPQDGWLERFCKDMHMLLLAELDLRLQPVTGLIEAFKQDTQ